MICIKDFLNWKAKIDRKTFLVRFSCLILFSIINFFIPIRPINLVLSSGISYMLFCTIYQYIRTVDSKNTLITYFTWIIFYTIFARWCISPFIAFIENVLSDFSRNYPGLKYMFLSLIAYFPIAPVMIFLLAWMLSTKTALFIIQKIVDQLIGIWEKISSIFHR